jgi:SAM-dependent methyltransferase
MTTNEILAQAIEVVPAVLGVWALLLASYWFLGFIKFPRARRREAWVDGWGSLDRTMLGNFDFHTLALISLVSLFLELLLIRWITSEIRIFAYFKSLVLIACFLGFGLGCYLTRTKIRLAFLLVPLLGMVLMTQLPWEPLHRLVINLSSFIGWFSDVHVFGRAYFSGQGLFGLASALIALSIVIPLFGLIAITFIPLGQLVGLYLENSTNGIRAYSINILASVAGIWLFTLLSFFSTPPIVWFAFLVVGLGLFVWRMPRARRALVLVFAAIFLLFVVGASAPQWWGEQSWKGSLEAEHLKAGQSETFWSPYQKLTVIPLERGGQVVRYILNTNDSWYQQMMDLSPEGIAKLPESFTDIPAEYYQYNLPYKFYPAPPTVLIAGAGSGNDAAAALRHNAGHVTAVEIDPLIYELGKKLHFEHPYTSDRVELHVDDARSFVQNTKQQYDLVVYSILDSQTTSSYYTNIRLDNYVYTLEAMQATKQLLKPNGLFVLSFSSERSWFTTRLRDVVTKAFGKPPLMVQTNVSFFVVGNGDRVEQTLAANPDLKKFVEAHQDIEFEDADLITDDWPYLYQQFRGIPMVIWLLSIALIALCWAAFARFKGSREGVQWHFFFLGAAFTLLEVQIISKIALLFGTTWLVNSIVITVLLALILLANLFVSRFPQFPRQAAYVGLLISIAIGYWVPTGALFFDSILVRALAATLLYCAPAFFAGIVFISSFKEIGFRAEAFGSNLLGSLVGGLLESLSFLVGLQALVLAAGLLYVMSLLTMSRGVAKTPVSQTVDLAE